MIESIINSFLNSTPFFYLIGLAAFLVLVRLVVDQLRKRRYGKWLSTQKTLSDLIYNLRPEQFEDYVGRLLPKLGYQNVVVIGGINKADGGFDIKAERGGQKYFIQVKKYGPHHPVGVLQVRSFFGALKADHPSAKGIFITTSFFTYGFPYTAESFAKKVGIELVDGRRLAEMISLADKKSA